MTNLFDNMKVVPQTQVQKPQQPLTEPQTPVAVATSPVVEQVAIPAAPQTDTVEISKPKKERKGPIKAVKGFIANVKKFFATLGIYTKATASGIGTGAIAGISVFGITEIANVIKKKAAHGKNNKLGIALGAVTALGVLASKLWTASLDATQKQSEIEHRWTGHQ